MDFTEFRLKIRRFFKKHRKTLLIAFIILFIVYLINYIIANRPVEYKPTTTLDVHTSVIDSNSSTPTAVAGSIEKRLEEYIACCNEGNYQKAFNMLSEECRQYSFDNDIVAFMEHVLIKMPTPKRYAIQNYSNVTYSGKRMYIYEVKYTDDLLATGLTNSQYAFTSEKFVFYYEDDVLKMCAGDFLYHTDIKNISENEYLKIDVVDKIVNYSIETYQVKFTNRSEYTIVLADSVENDEVVLRLPNEVRKRSELQDIVLEPGQEMDVTFTFPKFADDGDASQALLFSSIRVMETYSGTNGIDDAVIQSEIDNAIAKFSMEVTVSQ